MQEDINPKNKKEGENEQGENEGIHENDDMVEKLLKKFLIGSESSFLDDINLVLMMKALPSKINRDNMLKMKMFNFSIFQNSLIAFQNRDQVKSFEHFDNLNKSRVQKIRESILEQKDDLESVDKILRDVH